MDKKSSRRLTIDLAKKYLSNNWSVSIGEFTTIDEDAAKVLGRSAESICLNGLTDISVSSAQSLAKCKGACVMLDGLVTISEEVAEALAKVEYVLSLSGLAVITDAVAERLAKLKGGYLALNGLTTLSVTAASCFGNRKGRDNTVHLTGLASLTDQAVAELAKYSNLYLKGYAEAKIAEYRKSQRKSQGTSSVQQAGYPAGYKPKPLVEAMVAQTRSAQPKTEPVNPKPSPSQPASESKGFFGNLVALFTKWKCPKCGERAGEKVNTEHLGDTEQVVESRVDPVTKQYRQMVVNRWTVRLYFKCQKCNHEWTQREGRSEIA